MSEVPKGTNAAAQSVLLILVIVGVAAGVWFGFPVTTASSSNAPREIDPEGMITTLAGVPTRGNPAAPLVLIEFSDFQCPFCARFATEIQGELLAKYVDSGRVSWAFRHLPLVQIHKHAVKAAESAECAARQGRFWEAHDALFQDPQAVSSGQILPLVQATVADANGLAQCVNDGLARQRLSDDVKEAERLGLRTTPTFVLGVRQPDGSVKIATVLRGVRTAADFAGAVDRIPVP